MDKENGMWRTIKGRRIFIREGESLVDAMRNSGKFTKVSYGDIGFGSKIPRQELIDKYKISEEERDSVNDYTSAGYKTINPELKDSYGDLSKCSKEVENKCRNIDSVLEKLPKHKGIVHRKEPGYMAAKYKEGETYVNDFYTSTTAWGEITGVVQLEFRQHSGCNITKFSANPGENEVLLPRGFCYRVTKIEKTSSGYTKVYAEEVG